MNTEPSISAGVPAPDTAERGWPPVAWLVVGSAAAYIVFVSRVFLSVNDLMVFDEYVPRLAKIGNDLRTTLDHMPKQFTEPSPYPPLGMLILRPLASFSFYVAYRVMCALTIMGLLFLTLGAPALSLRRPVWTAESLFVLAVALMSYPLHFELERGQGNALSVSLTVAGPLLYHRFPDRWVGRVAGVLLFVAGMSLKLYPVLFMIAFWRRDRGFWWNVRWMAIVFGAVVLSFAVFGVELLTRYVRITTDFSAAPYVWAGNHSITGFAGYANVPAWPSTVLLATLVLLVAVRVFRREFSGNHPLLLCAVLMTALLVPTMSMDYTLAAMPMVPALVFGWLVVEGPSIPRLRRRVLLAGALLLSAAYHLALVPFTAKTHLGPWSMNPHPLMMVMVACLAVFVALWRPPALPASAAAETR